MIRNQIFPEPTVGALIQDESGKVLLCDSHKWPGFYTVPGGHVEIGETCEDALIRECKEEVGLDIKVHELLSIQQVIRPKEFWRSDSHFIFFDYLASKSEGQEAKVDANEIQRVIWVEPNEALDLKIDRYLRHFVLRFIDKSQPFMVAWK